MKTIKLKFGSVLACLLLSVLLFVGESLWAQGYKMTSDVICATGGKSESSHFKMKVSAGGQGSPIGSQSSTNFRGFGGWVYTTSSTFMRGDMNCDWLVNLGDVVYLITYLYKSGPAPCILAAGDVNGNGNVDIGDVVYLITYLYKGGPPPPCAGKGDDTLAQALRLPVSMGHAQVSLMLMKDQVRANVSGLSKVSPQGLDEVSEISVGGKFDRDIAGVELEIDFNPNEVIMLDPALTPMTKGFQLFSGIKDGTQKIGIVDLSGKNLILAGDGILVNLRAKGEDLTSIRIKKAILVDEDANSLVIELSSDLKDVTVKNPSLLKQDFQESRPTDFSLSQNYPNPFNPQTSIKYALPHDCYVKLVIYNVLGRKVKTLVDERQSAGFKTAWWDGKDNKGEAVASGVYFYRLEADKFSEIKKMMLVK